MKKLRLITTATLLILASSAGGVQLDPDTEVITVSGSYIGNPSLGSLPGQGYGGGTSGGSYSGGSGTSNTYQKCINNAQGLYGSCFKSRESNSKNAFAICAAGASLLKVKAIAAAAAYACSVARDDASEKNQQYCLEKVIDAQKKCKP